MPRYAQNTSVSVARSKAELESTLTRYGADDIMTAQSQVQAVAFVAFTMKNRSVKIKLPLPRIDEFATRVVGSRYGDIEKELTEEQQQRAWKQACRQRWRALLLMVKGKLEYVELMPDAFDHVFLADFVLPKAGGRTIGEEVMAQLDQLTQVPMLPFGKRSKT